MREYQGGAVHPRRRETTGSGPDIRPLWRINLEMDHHAARGFSDEASLERFWGQIRAHAEFRTRHYWLTLARLGELALWWAGTLANAGEYQAVGDLLLNPLNKTLFIKNRPTPLNLNRHGSLTGQVRAMVPQNRRVIDWLKSDTVLAIGRKALLPAIFEELCLWAEFGGEDQARFQRAMSQISGALCAIKALNIPEGVSLAEHLSRVAPEDLGALAGRMCDLGLARFKALAREMENLSLARGGRPAKGALADFRDVVN